MSKKEQNISFICIQCKKYVLPLANGSYRNHCPFCLASIHVDCIPGDRMSPCKGIMIPKRLVRHSKKGWQIIHQCQSCGIEKTNKIAEGSIQSDDWDILLNL